MSCLIRFTVYLSILGIVLTSCSARQPEMDSPFLSPGPTVNSQSSTPTDEPVTASPEPLPTATSVVTRAPNTIATTHITEESSIIDVRWSDDGRTVQYATRQGEWWAFEVATGAHYPIANPFDLDFPSLLDQLQARPASEEVMWFRGGISPSGSYVVYNRLPLDHDYTPTSGELYLPPYEIWIAQSDGSNTRSLGSCWTFTQVIWFEGENEILFACGYEGALEIYMASVDGSSRTSLTRSSGLGLYGRMVLSPDETKLAITAEPPAVFILFLDTGETLKVADHGYVSGWSSGGQWLYYQDFGEPGAPHDLYVYDLSRNSSVRLLSSPLHTTDGMTISIPLVEVSPLGNAAVFNNNTGVWLVTWSP